MRQPSGHGYRKVFNKHVVDSSIASLQINRLTTKDCQDYLDGITSLTKLTYASAKKLTETVRKTYKVKV